MEQQEQPSNTPSDPISTGDQPIPDWSSQPPKPVKKRSTLQIVGIVIATILAVGGLVFVGFIILFMIALSSYGSNK